MPGLGEREGGAGFDYAAVIGRCAAGDEDALHELYERDAHAMRRIAARILGRHELAEDAVHDTFVQVWQRASSFDTTRATGRSWLMAILRYRALNMRRSAAREDLTDCDPRADELDEGIDAEAGLILSEQIRALTACLARLGPPQREALLLAYEAELSHSELASHLGLPLGTAKSWIRRAHAALRQGMHGAAMLAAGVMPCVGSLVEMMG